jgi:folate-dependent phosphoribosylglycinamide formyltransferase PurN
MRVVILCPSPYSETSCAMAVRLAQLGYVPTGAVTLPSLDLRTLARKLGQWGAREVVRYAQTKLISRNRMDTQFRNAYLKQLLQTRTGSFRSLREVAACYGFPIVACKDQNAPDAIAQLNAWSPDLMVFTGGDILRKQLLQVPRLGVINLHLGLLPEVRGMSSPEWSLLSDVPVGVTVHYIDAGIDTGPILRRCEFPDTAQCASLDDLRNRLIAFGIEMVGQVVTALDRGTISAMPQSNLNEDDQYFVMHEWLQAQAAQRLKKGRLAAAAVRSHG